MFQTQVDTRYQLSDQLTASTYQIRNSNDHISKQTYYDTSLATYILRDISPKLPGIVNILPGFLHATFIMFISLHRLVRCIRRLSFKMDRFLTARKASILSGRWIHVIDIRRSCHVMNMVETVLVKCFDRFPL